jgi:hypothetical protein
MESAQLCPNLVSFRAWRGGEIGESEGEDVVGEMWRGAIEGGEMLKGVVEGEGVETRGVVEDEEMRGE